MKVDKRRRLPPGTKRCTLCEALITSAGPARCKNCRERPLWPQWHLMTDGAGEDLEHYRLHWQMGKDRLDTEDWYARRMVRARRMR